MEILAIYPRNKTLSGMNHFPLGFSTILAVVEKQGHTVNLLDMHNLKISYITLERTLNKTDYSVCLISATSPYIKETRELVNIVKKIRPKCITIIGGVGVSDIPEIGLQYTGASAVSTGEAELSLPKALRSIENNQAFIDVDGFCYRDRTGKIILNQRSQIVEDLDLLPFPAYHLFNIDLIATGFYRSRNTKNRTLGIQTSRGCPYACNFCINSVNNNKKCLEEIFHDPDVYFSPKRQRFRSIDNLAQEIKFLKDDYGINQLLLWDETTNSSAKRVFALCDLLEKMEIKWQPSMRIDTCTEKMLKRMKEAGCQYIHFGFETASPKIRKAMNKTINIEKTEKVIKSLNDCNIPFHINFMIGYPGETEETVLESVEFCEKYGFVYSPVYFTLFTNSLLFHTYKKNIQNWDEYFTRIAKSDWQRKLAFNLTNLSDNEIMKLRSWGVSKSICEKMIKNHPMFFKNIVKWLLIKALWIRDRLPGKYTAIVENFIR